MSSNELVDYYSRRAKEYEEIFQRDDPIRQGEQDLLATMMREVFSGRRVLEVACGTGYWTERFATAAASVVAIDLSPEVLAVFRQKQLPEEKVKIRHADAWSLDGVEGTFDAGLVNFWLSHISRPRVAGFLRQFHRRLEQSSIVFMSDNVFVPGEGGDFVQSDKSSDTFKMRTLADGSRHKVLKNYYTASELKHWFAPYSRNLKIHCGHYFWWATYETV